MYKYMFEHTDNPKSKMHPQTYLSHVMRKPAFTKFENKGTEQLHSHHTDNQCLCIPYIDGTFNLLPKSEVSSLKQSSVAVQTDLCWTLSGTLKPGPEDKFSREVAQLILSL